MITRSQKFRLSVFVLVCIALLAIFLVRLIGSNLLASHDYYQIRYEISVSGLEIGAPVKYNGVRVGRVEKIWIDPHHVSTTIVSLDLQHNTPIKENTKAVLNVQGITGLKFIELVGGTSDAQTLDPGSTILAEESLVEKLTGQAEDIALKVEMLLNQFIELTSEENRRLVSNTLESTANLINTAEQTIRRNAPYIDQIVSNARDVSKQLTSLAQEVRGGVLDARKLIVNIRNSMDVLASEVNKRVSKEELGVLISEANEFLARLNDLTEKIDLIVVRSREDLNTTFHYLSETTENLLDFSRLIREDPSRILRTREEKERKLP